MKYLHEESLIENRVNRLLCHLGPQHLWIWSTIIFFLAKVNQILCTQMKTSVNHLNGWFHFMTTISASFKLRQELLTPWCAIIDPQKCHVFHILSINTKIYSFEHLSHCTSPHPDTIHPIPPTNTTMVLHPSEMMLFELFFF